MRLKYGKILSYKFLYKNYILKKKSTTKIAKSLGLHTQIVCEYLRKYNIQMRTSSESQKLFLEHHTHQRKNKPFNPKHKFLTKDLLYKEYIENKNSLKFIGKKYNIHWLVIRDYLKKYNIPIRPKSLAILLSFKLTNRSEKISGKNNCNYGKKFSKQRRKQMSLNLIGKFVGEKNFNWRGGISFLPYSLEWTKELRLKIRERDNFTCQCCGLKEENHFKGKQKANLTVHHIDYNKQNCKEDNLITTCIACNSKANGNKELDRDYWFAYFTYLMSSKRRF